MKTRKDFERDFNELIETEDLYIEYESLEYTIFILADGTPINAMFEFGYRATDHNAVLSEPGYTMDEMVTIEPESQTIILPKAITEEQLKTIKGYDNLGWQVTFQSVCNEELEDYINELIYNGFKPSEALTQGLGWLWYGV